MSEPEGTRGTASGCVVAIEAASTPGGAACERGSAIIIGPHHLLTCAHVVATQRGKGAVYSEIRIADSEVVVTSKQGDIDAEADLVLLRSDRPLSGRPARWLDKASVEAWLRRGRAWRAEGYDARTRQVGYADGLSWLTNTNNDVQIHGGIPAGYSGGLLSPSKGAHQQLGIGMLVLGGETAATSRALYPDVLQRFLDSCRSDIMLDQIEWRPPPSRVIDDFRVERARHGQRFGRESLLARLRWLAGFDGWVILKGSWGVGKSAVLHYLLQEMEQDGSVPHHFIRRGIEKWDQPAHVAENLALQVRWLFKEADEMPPTTGLLSLLQAVSSQVLVPQGRRLTLIVDGLDEIGWREGGNPLEFLPRPLPPRVTFIVASRQADPHLTLFAGQRCFELDLDEAPDLRESSADACRQYLVALGESSDVAQRLSELVEGKFLICEKMLGSLGTGRTGLSEEQLLQVARGGLDGLFKLWWSQRVTGVGDWHSVERIKLGLGYLCAAREALPRHVLKKLAGKELRVDEFRAAMLPMLRPTSGGNEETFAIDHDTLRDFFVGVLDEPITDVTRRLANLLCRWSDQHDGFERRYVLQYGLHHWRELRDWESFEALALDASFLEALSVEVGINALNKELDEAFRDLGDRESPALLVLRRYVRTRVHGLRSQPGLLTQDFHMWCVVEGIPARETLRRLGEPKVQLIGGGIRRDESDLVLRGHSGRITDCVVTVDEKHMVSASSDHNLRVWDLQTGACVVLVGHGLEVSACAVTANGARVVSASMDWTLRVWELTSGTCIHTLKGHSYRGRVGGVTACAVTPDGECAVSASVDCTLRVWDLRNGNCLHILEGHSAAVDACAVTANGTRIVSASRDGTLRVWDLQTGKCLHALQGHSGRITALLATPDGERAVSGSADKTLRVWQLETGTCLQTLEGHSGWVNGCSVTADGTLLVSASLDKTIRVWDLSAGVCAGTLQGHQGSVDACAVTADGTRAVSASEDKTLRVWDIKSGKCLYILRGHQRAINACGVIADGARAVSASDDYTLRAWHLGGVKAPNAPHSHSRRINACAITPDGERALSASSDNTLKAWDLTTGACIHTLVGHSHRIKACAITADGERAVSASFDRSLRVWDLKSGNCLLVLRGHLGSVNACAITADGARLVSGSSDGTLRVWNLTDKRCAFILKCDSAVSACMLTPDGKLAAAVSGNLLHVWDLKSGTGLRTLHGSSWVLARTLQSDGEKAISLSTDGVPRRFAVHDRLKVWDLTTGNCVHTLCFRGFLGSLNACTLVAEAERAVTVSGMRTLKVWDLKNGACIHEMADDSGYAGACEVSANGKRAVLASDNATINWWDLDSGKCLSSFVGLGGFTCVATSMRGRAVVGDDQGNVWLLDVGAELWPRSLLAMDRSAQ